MNVPRIRLNWIARILVMCILLSVLIFFTVKATWADESAFIQVRATLIQWIIMFMLFTLASMAILYHKSTICMHIDGKFTHAAVKLSKIEIPYKKGGRSALLPFWLVKHDGFNALTLNIPGKGERGGIEVVPHVPDKDNTKYGAMIQEVGDNYVIQSAGRKAHIGIESHNKLGVIWDGILEHGNTTGCRYGEDTIIYMHPIPGMRAVVPEKVLDRMMDLTEVSLIHGQVLAEERGRSARLQEEIESKSVRNGSLPSPKNVDQVRDPSMETEQ